MAAYVKVVTRNGVDRMGNTWLTDPASLPVTVTDTTWDASVTQWGHGWHGLGGNCWVPLGANNLSPAYELSNVWTLVHRGITVGSELHDMTALRRIPAASPIATHAPIVLLASSPGGLRRGSIGSHGDELQSVTVTWSSRSDATAESAYTSLSGLYDDRLAAFLARATCSCTDYNELNALATASTAATAAYWSQLGAYLTAIRRALYVQLGG